MDNNNFNIFNASNIDITKMSTTPIGRSPIVNPMIAAFEQNRYIKDDNVLHYAVAFTSMTSSTKKEDCMEEFRDIIFTKNAYCLIGFSRRRMYFQYYDLNGSLAGTFALDSTQCKKVESSSSKDVSFIKVVFDKKNKITFALPHVVPNENGIRTFGDRDQTVVVKQIIDELKNKNILY